MNDEERRAITEFIQRVAGANRGSASGWSQQTQPAAPPLPPVDAEADGLLAELFSRHPEARYRVTQTAFTQEGALTESQRRIQQLEAELEQARQAPAPQPSRGGMFGGLFGGGR